MLYCRLLLQAGDVPGAVAQYKLAIETDPDVSDPVLSEQLGVGPEAAGDVVEGRVRESWQEAPPEVAAEIERPKFTFHDVGGMDALEEIGAKIIYPLRHPEMYRAYGKAIGGGILMYGPPGCGKTYLARATAGEIRPSFLSVGINDVLEMWIGNSERNLHALFEQARSHKPCVLFFDEVDALGGRRSDMSGGGARHLINQFLAEMDGIGSSNEGVLVLAATNAPWHVDPAFRRPGRFDRVLFVPPPDVAARAAILQIHCFGKPGDNLDFPYLAKKDRRFLGRGPQGRSGRGHRNQTPRGDQGRPRQAADQQRSGDGGEDTQADHARMVLYGPQLRPLFEPGGNVRRSAEVPEDVTGGSGSV